MLNNLFRLLLLPFAVMRSGSLLANAKALEKKGMYGEACYAYGIVLLNCPLVGGKSIRENIRRLWQAYGPFDFDKELKEEIEKHGDTPEHCAEAGHAAVVSIIREIVTRS